MSSREREVYELLKLGLTNMQMAARLYVTVHAIKARRKKLYEKANAHNTAAVLKYWDDWEVMKN